MYGEPKTEDWITCTVLSAQSGGTKLCTVQGTKKLVTISVIKCT